MDIYPQPYVGSGEFRPASRNVRCPTANDILAGGGKQGAIGQSSTTPALAGFEPIPREGQRVGMARDRPTESATDEDENATSPQGGDEGNDLEVEYDGAGGYGNEAGAADGSSSASSELLDDTDGGRSQGVEVTVNDATEESGVTSSERAALERVDAMAHALDEAVRIPGTDVRFGLDPMLGILPGSGDAVAAALSLYPIVEAYRLDAPRSTIAKMLSLVAVDAIVGSVPVLGVLFDAYWKANEWNARTLERHVEGT